ncbi:MAG: diguanylate cyclase [Treponemataceae bacterium]|nr:diguanylate cyclase [Treponemataceae bacterium]
MVSNMYWITAFLFAVVLAIIALEAHRVVSRKTVHDRAFLHMLYYGIYFCLQDMFWGLCDSSIVRGDTALFIASSLFHLSIVLTSFFWLNFFLAYLGNRIHHRYLHIGVTLVFILIQIVLVSVNCVQPVLFRIEDGQYITESLRPVSFINQYIVFLISAAVTFRCAVSSPKNERHQYFSVFWVSATPLLTGAFQLAYPEAPFYSFGYFLGCFVIYFFIISRERTEAYQQLIINAIAGTFYTMHLYHIDENRMEPLIEPSSGREMTGGAADPQAALNRVMELTVTDAYRESVLEFIDFSTLEERLQHQSLISMDYQGRLNGWIRASFISVERDENGRQLSVMFTTQIIEEQKKKEQEMLARSTTDQLTEVHNRRAYEEDILQDSGNDRNMVYVSIDVNGLKVVNDTLGHVAGDEMLLGAANCMKQCFGSYGKIYRTGGDEFAVILFANDAELEHIKSDFREMVEDWKGIAVDSLAVSCGYVRKSEFPDATVAEMADIADERMYKEKAAYYQRKGVDRRGQNEAHKALCALYTKILRINVTDDSFTVVNMNSEEMTVSQGYAETISGWLRGFCLSGSVHPDDVESYLKQTDLEYLRSYFAQGNKTLSILYRRKYGDEFRHVVMEMIPAGDYAPDNQSLFLYVKEIGIMPQWL